MAVGVEDTTQAISVTRTHIGIIISIMATFTTAGLRDLTFQPSMATKDTMEHLADTTMEAVDTMEEELSPMVAAAGTVAAGEEDKAIAAPAPIETNPRYVFS